MIKRIANIFISLFVFFIFASGAYALENSVIKSVIPDEAGRMLYIKGTNFNNLDTLKTFKLSNPSRTVVDLPNTILAGGARFSFDLPDQSVSNVKISQFSTYPNVVRIVFTSDKSDSLDNIKISHTNSSMLLEISPVEYTKKISLTGYQDKDFDNKTNKSKTASDNYNYVINSVTFKNNCLNVSGTGNFLLKEPLVQDNPSRIIYDIPDSTISFTGLPKTYIFLNGDKIKVSQNTPDTVRIVVETINTDNYKTIISPDSQTFIISPKDKINTSDLPNGKILSSIKKVDIKKIDKDTTVLTIKASNPLIHYIKRLRSQDAVRLELYNASVLDKAIIANLVQTDQFQGLSVSNIEKYTNGSSWLISLGKNTRVEAELSFDGKILEITLKDVEEKACVSSPISKAQVVIDPGHGGSEPGAMKDGIFEKDITIDVAKKVKNYLNQVGVDVVMTRSDDETVSLKQRTMITCEVNPQAFVSIHVNSCEAPSVTGLETHWYTPQSKSLAKVIQSRITSSINSTDRGIMNSMFYVIHHTDVPAVLVEIGFMSNDSERQQLLTPERQEATARAIADGIIRFLNSKPAN